MAIWFSETRQLNNFFHVNPRKASVERLMLFLYYFKFTFLIYFVRKYHIFDSKNIKSDMKRKQKAFLHLFLVSISFVGNLYSQESIVVAGGKGTGNGGASSYSVGQIVNMQLRGSGGSAQEGVQQPYEITTLSNDQFDEINLVMIAFPNPVIDELNLTVFNNKFESLSYNLIDTNGKILSKDLNITLSETKVSMHGLPQGVYFLNVINNSKTIKTFKIIKK